MLGTFELVACTEKEMLPFADMLLSLKDQILPEGKSATLHVASANTAAVAGNTSTEIPVGGDLAERGTLRRSGAWVGSDVARVMLEEHLVGVAGLERADKRQADKNQATQSQAPGAAAPMLSQFVFGGTFNKYVLLGCDFSGTQRPAGGGVYRLLTFTYS